MSDQTPEDRNEINLARLHDRREHEKELASILVEGWSDLGSDSSKVPANEGVLSE
jgi:hypothetical protein